VDDVRRFQLQQHESGIGVATINSAVSAVEGGDKTGQWSGATVVL
jgi:hypothetical protein